MQYPTLTERRRRRYGVAGLPLAFIRRGYIAPGLPWSEQTEAATRLRIAADEATTTLAVLKLRGELAGVIPPSKEA